ncbi:MAG: UDP-N-acetylmuramoyl-L-alanyl-D-glutamate--2,6-diaminopimelate ligase [Pedosphaera sp. Tous-C6FEB]|nr:MAG: UDP-N-acetylmuramoyl-L-alanyl-D-glutamate--2,6-diaminopimelate ligase [Pedosphaera sp. Tous-C6FEB]
MLLKELLEGLPGLRAEGPLERTVTGVTADSRRVSPGMVFVAVPGENHDGHDFISTAIDRGAAAVICERNGFSSGRATKVKVADARLALAVASANFHGHPSRKLKVIGVTGTNGKTTVSFMVKHILETAGIHAGLLGTIRYEIGDRVLPAQRTTPEASEIQHYMAQMVRAGCGACVMEVSSHALAQKRVHGVEFDLAVFTNLTQDHLDFHGDMESYFEAKKELFKAAARGSKRGATILNVDDSFGLRLARETDVEIQLTYGVDAQARLRAVGIELEPEATRFIAETPAGSFPVTMPLIGRHNIYNALAAIGAGLALEVPVATIQSALRTLPSVPGRLERICAGQPFGVFVDYAHTEDALQHVLRTVREITPGRVLLACGCGGARDTDKRAKMGRVAALLADYTLITSDNPRRESPAAIAAQIEGGFRSVRPDQFSVELDRARAIRQLIEIARPGDTVLIAGKGHETYQEFEDTVVPFDDCVHAREALEEIGWGEPELAEAA